MNRELAAMIDKKESVEKYFGKPVCDQWIHEAPPKDGKWYLSCYNDIPFVVRWEPECNGYTDEVKEDVDTTKGYDGWWWEGVLKWYAVINNMPKDN